MGLRATITTVCAAVAGSPHLVADYLIDRVEDLDPGELRNLGIRHVIFDYDNTLAHWCARRPSDVVVDLISRLLEAGITVAVASNGLGRRFRGLAKHWNGKVQFLGGCKKPDSRRIEMLLRESGWDSQATLMVGDNVMTDVAAGRAAGCVTALVRPVSRFEGPPTKLWRFLEAVHRLRRPEWKMVTRLGPPGPIPPPGGSVWLQMVVLAAAAFLFLPILRAPAPGSETTSHQLGLARGFASGWPEAKPGEPERSLLIMAPLSLLGNHVVLPVPLAALSFAALLAGAAMCAGAARPGSGLALAAVTLPVVFAPGVVASIGEVSPAVLELFLVGTALTIPITSVSAGLVFLPSLLNGLSAVVLAPILIMRAPAGVRARVAVVLATVGLVAAACWVAAVSRAPVPSPGWSGSWADGAGDFSPEMGEEEPSVRARLAMFEKQARFAILGRGDRGTMLPLLSLAMLLSLPTLASRSPGAVLYLTLRGVAAVLLPGLFGRELLVVFVVFGIIAMCTVFRTSPRSLGPVMVAGMLALVILPDAPEVRRHAVSARYAYRANTELISLAEAARSLPPTACIATPSPALVHLVSLRSTETLRGNTRGRATHTITPRRDPVGEECTVTRTLMLCPR